ncbi:hypothetical protein DAEQUDRAFT_231555 [Daedalea quercina L-15889]|uniref:Secreted protein n=1 Tax=Daedalea quercina L-15889 TaxID=1314783 RepID=A0A165QTV4_9APHY|nr:hypothetical protein DAEQUDRAFT_231555 [Daedalea quercina L-15889]
MSSGAFFVVPLVSVSFPCFHVLCRNSCPSISSAIPRETVFKSRHIPVYYGRNTFCCPRRCAESWRHRGLWAGSLPRRSTTEAFHRKVPEKRAMHGRKRHLASQSDCISEGQDYFCVIHVFSSMSAWGTNAMSQDVIASTSAKLWHCSSPFSAVPTFSSYTP